MAGGLAAIVTVTAGAGRAFAQLTQVGLPFPRVEIGVNLAALDIDQPHTGVGPRLTVNFDDRTGLEFVADLSRPRSARPPSAGRAPISQGCRPARDPGTAAARELVADVDKARAATEAFAGWVEQQAPSKSELSGIGVDNYDWSSGRRAAPAGTSWRDEMTLMQRELARAGSSVELEERRNAALPPLPRSPAPPTTTNGRRRRSPNT